MFWRKKPPRLPPELLAIWKHGSADARALLEAMATAWRPGRSPAKWFVHDGGSAWPLELIDGPAEARARRSKHALVSLAQCDRAPCGACGSNAYVIVREEVDPAAFDRDRYLEHRHTLCPFCHRLVP